MTYAVDKSPMLFSWSIDTPPESQDHDALMMALSFEHIPLEEEAPPKTKKLKKLIFQKKKKKNDDEQMTCPARDNEPPERSSQSSSLVGTLDPDGNVEVVFYDALQFEDNARNELLSSTAVATTLRGGGSAYRSGSPFQDCSSHSSFTPPPPAPKELPLRFLRAGKGDPVEGRRRYDATLAWRRENHIDTILQRPNPAFSLIKRHYLHYMHLRGRNNELCFYEFPAKTNLKLLSHAGVTVDGLVWHYTQVIEFMWQVVDRNDFAKSVYVLDLDGIRFGDFVGDVMDFVKKASSLCSLHYPERAGYVFVINVPRWFNLIWTAVKPLVDEATMDKITIFRGTRQETCDLLQTRIPLYNLPPEYGGTSMPLGQSPEEVELRDWMDHNNNRGKCAGAGSCRFCSFVPARRY
jgi:hypothetical protein